jgi:hypothetical protein
MVALKFELSFAPAFPDAQGRKQTVFGVSAHGRSSVVRLSAIRFNHSLFIPRGWESGIGWTRVRALDLLQDKTAREDEFCR